ncbi:holdfast anchor protein HfaD [Brevundimonas diminuta]|uniref:holdfast anchor protein HfaD n=1 Tax=Brevundimonas diminuta TaxID=293 RepID=UPI0020976E38|nr:holdfast anchor protein HfaD [Brevundimonas diminuta]MCO8028332.1 holdfast anchor protein HfaD [Brevundimonas diminuta]
MARLAPTRLAGTIAATALCVAAAADASAQDRGLVLNEQLNLGDVISGQRLNVVNVSDNVAVSNAAMGNALSGGAEGRAADIRSTQDMQGAAVADTSLTLRGDTGYVNSVTQARGNHLAATAVNTGVDVEAGQNLNGDVTARTRIEETGARLNYGGHVSADAIGNTVALGASGTGDQRGAITGRADQNSTGQIYAENEARFTYAPAPAVFSSHASANAVQATSTPNSHQDLSVSQNASGDGVTAWTGVWAGNAWDIAGRSRAASNQAAFYNLGGSLVVDVDQQNSAEVLSRTEVSSYDFGAAYSTAEAVGNEVHAGNNDIYVSIDNTQMNTGGVTASAGFTGQNGYDAYVGANAAGNAVTGFACSTCGGDLNVRNSQTNVGDVRATATATVNGWGRNVVAGANAVGNTATFYVARPGN